MKKLIIAINVLMLVSNYIHSMEESNQTQHSLNNTPPKITISDFTERNISTDTVLEQNHRLCNQLLCNDHGKKNILWEKIIEAIESGNSLLHLSNCIDQLMEEGADPNMVFMGESLLHKALLLDCECLVEVLLKHNADYNYKHFLTGPIFFDAQTIEIARRFIEKGVDINTANANDCNILWHIVEPRFSLALMRFYLSKKVNVAHICQWDGSCILHSLAENHDIKDENNFLSKAYLLLKKCPALVNVVNNDNETPIQVAQKTIEEWGEKYPLCVSPLKKLITLFEKYKSKI